MFVAGTGRVIRREDLQRLLDHEAILAEGDTIKDGKVVDCNGEEVPVVTEDQHEKLAEAVRSGEVKTRDDVRRVIEETETPDR